MKRTEVYEVNTDWMAAYSTFTVLLKDDGVRFEELFSGHSDLRPGNTKEAKAWAKMLRRAAKHLETMQEP
jgi:hypothetical protein